MKQLPLYAMAHARSGDKGDGSNVGILAYDQRGFEILCEQVTVERVKSHFAGIVLGDVERFELPNLLGLNFLLQDSLGGGGSALDPQTAATVYPEIGTVLRFVPNRSVSTTDRSERPGLTTT